MLERLLLQGGRIVCPDTGQDIVGDVLVADGRVVAIDPGPVEDARTIDCRGMIVSPGWTDLGTELCDPGLCWREDLTSGSEAGAAGGYTCLVASPATDPVVDSPSVAADVIARASQVPGAQVRQAGALTVGLLGETLAELGLLLESGCVALSDGRRVMADSERLCRALEYSRAFEVPVFLRPGEPSLERSGVMNKGIASLHAGLRGISPSAEEIGIARIVALLRETDARVHLTQVTTAAGIALVRQAKSEGLRLTAAVPARHLLLCDTAVEASVYDTATRLLPPLRAEADRCAAIAGVKDGTIDSITADHVPWSRVEKELEFGYASPGANGLETALGASWDALEADAVTVVRAMAVGPAAVIGERAAIAPGEIANVVVFAPDKEWVVSGPFRSRGKAEPLLGRSLPVSVLLTIAKGRVVHGPQTI
jgi:dihydroorotase